MIGLLWLLCREQSVGNQRQEQENPLLGHCCSDGVVVMVYHCSDGDLDQSDSGGDGEKWSELEFILKIQLTGLADRLDLKCGRKIRSLALDMFNVRCLLRHPSGDVE